MKARLTAIGALVSTMLALPVGHATGQSASPIVRVTPGRGHAGDLIDLSGSGFNPGRHTYILMPCPNYKDPNWYSRGNFVWIPGPTTDSQGNFAGFLYRAPHLTGMASSKCQVYMAVIEDRKDFAAVGSYKIVARDQTLRRCERSLCVQSVIAAPKRVRAGLKEHIDVSGWPGARIDVVLSYPNKSDEHHIQHLDWQGRYSLTETVPAATADQTSVRITVRASLGQMRDTRLSGFTVTR